MEFILCTVHTDDLNIKEEKDIQKYIIIYYYILLYIIIYYYILLGLISVNGPTDLDPTAALWQEMSGSCRIRIQI